MERIRFYLIFVAVWCFVGSGFGQTGVVKDSGNAVDTARSIIVARDSLKPAKLAPAYSPAAALTSSIIIPGAGQIYTRHYLKGGLFLVAETGIGLFAYQRYIWEKTLQQNADSVSALAGSLGRQPVIDTLRHDTTYPGVAFRLEADRDRFDAQVTRYVIYQSISWMVGAYYYNILDALHATGIFKSDTKKNPAVAGWLSAIPGLGLGQFYNGETSKAGMILMTQFNLGFLAFNYNHLMKECENYEVSFANGTPEYSVFIAGGFQNDWENRRNEAFRNRNMYLWYSLMFYFYAVLDAVVDAHLHDAAAKMRLEPDLVPQSKQVGMTMTVPF
jgi:TM2 domain-containing membrane protein YozV